MNQKSDKAQKVITENRKARHDYEVLSTYEAGLVLNGSEVKSLREGSCQLKDSYVDFQSSEMFLVGVHISMYKASSYNNHFPERRRKLLMHREEINRLYAQIREKGLTIVPLKMYFLQGRAKVELALVKGKKDHDKRATIKKRDANRELAQVKRKFR
jgi:SsrA-binding protein